MYALLLAALVPACGSSDAAPAVPTPLGQDGGFLGPDAGRDDCPDPDTLGVHYQSRDLNLCPPALEFTCDVNQNGFYNACGCGCIDKGTSTCMLDPDPRLHFVSHDTTECASVKLDCSSLQQAFNNTCGCGCIDP